MKFIETLDKLISGYGITRNKLLLDINVNTNSFVNWEQRGNIPSGKVLIKISQYFKVSIDDLLDNRLPKSSNSEISLDNHIQYVYDKYDEQLFNLFHLLNEDGKLAAIAHTEFLSTQGHFKKPHLDKSEDALTENSDMG
jgi:transcriptional regulator with XRE-family HTH domain